MAGGVDHVRYQFPYMDRGAKRPDPPQLAQATVRAAVTTALDLLPKIPLIAGGKSFGGRMTSQAQAKAPLQGVCGLAFLGFPLNPAGRPSQERAKHLFDVHLNRCARNSTGLQRSDFLQTPITLFTFPPEQDGKTHRFLGR